MKYEDLVSDHYAFWLLYSDRFFHAAKKLEEVVRKAEQSRTREFKKLNLHPGIWKVGKSTKKLNKAEMDRSCHHVYPYLYYHSLELLLKGLARAFSLELTKKNHSLSEVFDIFKKHIEPLPFKLSEIKKMLSQLDGIYWAQRYPYPFKNTCKDDILDKEARHLTIDHEGIGYPSNNIGLIFDQRRETFMKLREHILNHENVKQVLPKPISIN